MGKNIAETYLAQMLYATSDTVAYDANAKALLADKQVLARILQHTLEEFREMALEDIIACIGEDIEISAVPIDPGLTNIGRIQESKNEDAVPGEGISIYDIRFSACLQKKEGREKLLIDLEAQKSSASRDLHYHLENRVVFYLARMISAQKNTEFYHSDYDRLRNVRSIWICMDKEENGDAIEEIHLERKTVFGHRKPPHSLNLMQGILIHIRTGGHKSQSRNPLIAMLEVLFARMDVSEKMRTLETEYGMVMTVELERRLENMCNLSECFIDQGLEQGQKQGMAQSIFSLLEEIGEIPRDIIACIAAQQDMDILRNWIKVAAKAQDFEAFREKIVG